MSDNRTIKEMSDEFNVTKQAVRKRLTSDFREKYVVTVTSNGVQTLVVSHAGYLLLKKHFTGNIDSNQEGKPVSNYTNEQNLSIIDLLNKQLHIKDTQIEGKDLQILKLQNLLDQQQQLQLQTQQMLDEKMNLLESTSDKLDQLQSKRWWKFW